MDNGSMMRSTEVCVVGGGPAGLAAAIAARRRGFDVVVADSMLPPIDKPCGEGLMPDGLAALSTLGIQIPASEAFVFRGIRFVNEEKSVEANFPHGYAVGVRRTVLHRIMVEHAAALGVRFLWGSVVSGLERDGIRVNGEILKARWIIGADGSQSRVRRWAGLDAHWWKDCRYAFRRHYRVAPWSQYMELHWGPDCQIYVTPIAADEVCVVVMSRNPKLRLDEALSCVPSVERRLRGKEGASVERGAATVTRKLRRVTNGRLALVGDASGGVDAITGEGLRLTFCQAAELANSLAEGRLDGYEQAHRRLFWRPALMGQLTLLLGQPGKLRRRAMQALEREPSLLERILAAHVGDASHSQMAKDAASLAWGMLSAAVPEKSCAGLSAPARAPELLKPFRKISNA
ncbi:MAG TPA: NAD(P)/FAD-dependent oxidoreductase [Candidatus Binatia bacterium]|nr:NAD(P)/FAD-dependent oxidoreductase [Candidatus Binatia bacterium]